MFGVQKIIKDRGWLSMMSNIPKFVSKAMHEFYANLTENICVLGKKSLKKFVRDHVYDFSPKAIWNYLNILYFDFDDNEDYVLDDVASELYFGTKFVWPKSNALRVADLILKCTKIL